LLIDERPKGGRSSGPGNDNNEYKGELT